MARTPRTRKSVSVTNMSFNIQEFLANMEEKLVEQMERGFTEVKATAALVAADLKKHTEDDTRVQNEIKISLKSLGGLQRNIKWFIRTLIGAVVAGSVIAIFDVMKNHWKP